MGQRQNELEFSFPWDNFPHPAFCPVIWAFWPAVATSAEFPGGIAGVQRPANENPIAWSTRSHDGSTATSAMKQHSFMSAVRSRKRFAGPNTVQLTFVVRQAPKWARQARAGFLPGAVRTDQSDDCGRPTILRVARSSANVGAVFFFVRSFASMRRGHMILILSFVVACRGAAAAGCVKPPGVCANNSCEENPRRLMTARICGQSSLRNRSRSPSCEE